MINSALKNLFTALVYLKVLWCLGKVNAYVSMCWYVNWSESRDILPFRPENINYSLCSHILYSPAIIDPTNFDIVFLQPDVYTNMIKIIESKKTHKDLKVLLTIGSYDTKSYGFDAVANPDNLNAMNLFSLNLVKFLRKHDFDGVLIDYEFPNMKTRGSMPYTKHGFSLLLKTIRTHFDEDSTISGKERLILSSVAAARLDWIDSFYETDVIVKYVDYLLLLTYDLKSSKEKKARITSALFPISNETGFGSTLNQASAIAKWLTEGARPEQLVLGIAGYGRSYELTDPVNQRTPGSPVEGPGLPGPITEEPGVLAYFEICQKLMNSTSVREWQPESMTPYLIYDEKYFIGYEDIYSVNEKMLFIKANNLSGTFLWSMDLDDFEGKYCNQGPFPLLNAIKAELDMKEIMNYDSGVNAASMDPNNDIHIKHIEVSTAVMSHAIPSSINLALLTFGLLIYFSYL